ncbi:RdlA protein [Nostoc sp. DSM 114160]|jgi:hypothetical protein
MTNNKIADLETSLLEELSDAQSMLVVGGIGNDNGINTVIGNGASEIFNIQVNNGDLSPQSGLIQGNLNFNTQAQGNQPLANPLGLVNIPDLSGNASLGS